MFFPKSHPVPKKVSGCKTTLPQDEINHGSKGKLVDQMKVSERRREQKKSEKRHFLYSSVPQDRIYQRCHPQNSGIMFSLRKTSNSWKLQEKKRNCGSVFLLCMSPSAEKTKSCQLCLQDAVVSAEKQRR